MPSFIRSHSRLIIAVGSVVALAVVAWISIRLFSHPDVESTNDAYVQADFTLVAPRIAGQISDVMVNDNQIVKAGQLLVRIDDRDFRAALMSAEADVRAARASVANFDAEIARQPRWSIRPARRCAPTTPPFSSRAPTPHAIRTFRTRAPAPRKSSSARRARSPSSSRNKRMTAPR